MDTKETQTYEQPRVLRLGAAALGLGADCEVSGSGAIDGCFTGFGASQVCADHGNQADNDCIELGNSVLTSD